MEGGEAAVFRLKSADPLRRVYQSLLELLYPRGSHCLCCGHPRLADTTDCLCDACREEIRRLRVPSEACDRCLMPVRKGHPCAFCQSPLMKPIQAVYAPYRYGGAVRQLIHAFKFGACDEAHPLLSHAMAESLKDRDFDCLVPVPLHPRRERERGCNQALLLCRDLSAQTGIPVRELLRRDTYRRPQSRLPLRKRQANVSGAFSCRESPADLRVLLVDDVRTSGSTACACAKALKQAGAKSVSLCVCAVVYRKKPSN